MRTVTGRSRPVLALAALGLVALLWIGALRLDLLAGRPWWTVGLLLYLCCLLEGSSAVAVTWLRRLPLVALVVAVHLETMVFASWNAAVGWVAVSTLDVTALALLVLVAATLLGSSLLFSLDPVWSTRTLSRACHRALELYLSLDHGGSSVRRCQHLSHLFIPLTYIWRALVAAAGLLARTLLGVSPAWWRGRIAARGRYEVFLRTKIEQYAAETTRLTARYLGQCLPLRDRLTFRSRVRLRGGLHQLEVALRERARFVAILQDHLNCPSPPCTRSWHLSMVTEMAAAGDEALWARSLVLAMTGHARQHPVWERLRRNQRDYLQWLTRPGCPSSEFLRFRAACTSETGAAGPELASDAGRARRRAQLASWVNAVPGEQRPWVVRAALATELKARDWPAITEVYRSLRLETAFVLQREDHLLLGLARWRQSEALSATNTRSEFLRRWCVDRAMRHLFWANAGPPPGLLSSLGPED